MSKNIYRKLFRIVFSTSLLLLLSLTAFGQSTKVKGRVTDSKTGEGVPFVGIYFKGTQIGVTTDMDGYYSMETRDPQATILCAFLLGYDAQEIPVKVKAFNEINIKLKLSTNMINAATVKPDNSYMKWILKQIDKHRNINNPEKRPTYQCTVYNKMEIDLTNPERNLSNKIFKKNFGFVFDYMDTSVVSGRPYLPIMISETVAKRYHRNDPPIDKETIEASQISGLNSNNAVAQFTGSMHLRTNFYDNFINAFNVEIPSPISGSGDLYYNYFLIDSLKIDNRKTYKIRFHPKKYISTPSFDGEMSIDAEEWAIKDIHVKLPKGTNVNWIRDLVIDVENQRLGDSLWFYKNDKMYVDFSLQLKDSSKLASFIGHRDLAYYNPEFQKQTHKDIVEQGYNVMVQHGARERSEDYWDKIRPYQLTEKEKNIYKMVEEVKDVPLYKDIYTIVNTFISGYYEIGKISFGPYSHITSYNNLEGRRFQMGIRTTKEFSKKIRLMGYAAYGLRDQRWKGGGTVEYMFNNLPTRKLLVRGSMDVMQLGKGAQAFAETNILTSIFAKDGGGFMKKSRVDELSFKYEHEFNGNFTNMLSLETRRVHSNRFVPMLKPDSTRISSVASNWLRYTMRFSWNEAVTRGTFEKQYLYTKYPVLTLDFLGSVKGFWRNDYNYCRAEATIKYNLRLPPVGTSYIKLNAGKVIGKVPYPMLKLHEGNGTYFLDKSAFACMDYYEFASDTWVTCFYEHNFGGFFLGKIPLLRKLNLREIFTVKAAYGTLSEKNNGILTSEHSKNALLLFPEGMTSLNKPYVEMGVGITNIARVFRVDVFWRTTHRHHEVNGHWEKVPHLITLNFGLDFSF